MVEVLSRPKADEILEETIRKNFAFMRDHGPQWVAHTPLFRQARYDSSWLDDAEKPECYETLLPKVDGRTVVGFIDKRVKKLRSGEKLRILDVGCWTGDALSECLETERWAGKLDLAGITAQIPEWKKKELGEKGIRIEVADAHSLTETFSGGKFDLVMSSGSVGCMTDQARVLGQIWEVLNDKGVALISGAYWPMEKTNQLRTLNQYLKRARFNVVFDWIKWTTLTNRQTKDVFAYLHIVMKKNTERPLSLPLVRTGYKSFRPDCPPISIYDTRAVLPRFLFSGK